MHTYCHSTSVNDLWNAIKDIYKSCLIMVPNKESSTHFNQPWINNAVKRLSRRKQRCYNRARNTGLPEDWLRYHQVKKVEMSVIKLLITTSLILLTLMESNLLRNFGPILKAKNETTVVSVHCILMVNQLLIPWMWQLLSMIFLHQYLLMKT